jgi:glycoside/pentoside/hexuronide:cation symporter, GPH family
MSDSESIVPSASEAVVASGANVSGIREKVPVLEKAAWAAGGASDAIITTSIGQVALPVYNIGLGLDAGLVGLALAIPRAFDAILDPLMGNFSDNARTRWGRRRPFIFVGGILVTLLYWLTWCPPRTWSPTWMFAYLIGMSTCFYCAYTLYLIPHAALGFELSSDYNERTRIMAYRAIFGSIGGLFLPFFLTWSKSKLWSPTGDVVVGIRWVTGIAGFVMMLAILSAAIFCKEPQGVQKQEKIKLWPAFKYTMTNRPFLIVIGIIMLVIVACFLTGPFEVYVLRYYVAQGDEALGYWIYGVTGFLYGILGLIYTPIIAAVATRIGKRATLLGGIIMAATAFLSTLYFYRPILGNWFIYVPFISTPLEIPRATFWIMISKIMLSPGLTSVWILGFSMIADVCDFDELKSGLRREGMFGAMYNTVVIKIGISAVTVITGLAVTWSGYKSGVVPSETVLNNLRHTYAVIPAVILAFAFILALYYPLSEKKLREVRAQLASRKHAAARM